MDYVERSGLQIAIALAEFTEQRLLNKLEIQPEGFWSGYAKLLAEFMPRNAELLARRERLQAQIDDWAKAAKRQPFDVEAQKSFLTRIGYLVPRGEPFQILTENTDPEVAKIAGPQLVVPITNARYALNAANARWRSLYDALYGTDAIPGTPQGQEYDPKRGAKAVAWTERFLDRAFPLAAGSHSEVCAYRRDGETLIAEISGDQIQFADSRSFVGFQEDGRRANYVLQNNGLHIELVIDPDHPVGSTSASGLCDVIIESALTAIHDCEDSVAVVDAEDKVRVYSNWLGLMDGTLTATFKKGGKTVHRKLMVDRHFSAPNGEPIILKGRTVAMVRNVGHLMTTDAVRLNSEDTPEGIMDALFTATCALHDRVRARDQNSATGAIYVVKPKMHGPEEVAFADDLYARVEDLLGLPRNMVKLGLMDEERRTSANLTECMRQVKHRLAFINTGFLDRTGDEIHTFMQLGPVVSKATMKQAKWLSAYEDGNVEAGLMTGLAGRGQIGKGMWAKPDAMFEMLQEKIQHPLSGANTAWVPSPTAASLHATHYHEVDVFERLKEIVQRETASLDDLLTPPVMTEVALTEDELQYELDNNCQSILGYVVRWVDQGIGCSKVPDLQDVGLMEDRATLRISSQLLVNWLTHGLLSEAQIMDSLKRMAAKVDAQNEADPAYTPMAPHFDGPAFEAACDLILEGAAQPSGYTEPILHAYRLKAKSMTGGLNDHC